MTRVTTSEDTTSAPANVAPTAAANTGVYVQTQAPWGQIASSVLTIAMVVVIQRGWLGAEEAQSLFDLLLNAAIAVIAAVQGVVAVIRAARIKSPTVVGDKGAAGLAVYRRVA